MGEPTRGFWGLEWLWLDQGTTSLVLRLLLVDQRFSASIRDSTRITDSESSLPGFWLQYDYCRESPYHQQRRGGHIRKQLAPRPVSLNPARRFLDDPQWHDFTRSRPGSPTKRSGTLNEACAIFGLVGGERRSRIIQHCLRYGLLSLFDAGVLEFPEAAGPEFV